MTHATWNFYVPNYKQYNEVPEYDLCFPEVEEIKNVGIEKEKFKSNFSYV